MKILFSGLADSVGGVETFILGFSRWLRSQNVDVGFITGSEAMCYKDVLIGLGCKVHYVNCNRRTNPLGYKRELKKFFAASDYNVFYYNAISCSMIEILKQAKRHGMLCVTHSHSAWNGGGVGSFLHKIHKKAMSKMTDIAFACSDLAGQWLFDANIVQFELIPNGIDLEKYRFNPSIRREFRKTLRICENQSVIGHIGALSYIKNQTFLIDMLTRLNEKNDTVLVLIGKGEDEEKLRAYAKQTNTEDKVVFLGFVNNTHEYLNAFDLFVFPSLFEGLPIAVIEAQANGLPVLMSDTISKQACVAGNSKMLALTESIDIWCETAMSMFKNGRNEDNTGMLKEKGFDCYAVYKHIISRIEKRRNSK